MSNLRNLVDPKTRIVTSPSIPGSSKKYLLSASSGDAESAWTSATSPSHIHLTFPSPLSNATHFAVTFQGGFAPQSIMVYIATKPKPNSSEIELGLMMARRVFPEDKSKRQVFEIPYLSNTLISPNTQPLPVQESTLSTEDLRIETERPANPSGSTDPAPLLPAAKNRLPPTYPSVSAALDGSAAAGQSNGISQSAGSTGSTGSGSAPVLDRLKDGWRVPEITELKLEFEGASDNQGRVTVYSVEVLGA